VLLRPPLPDEQGHGEQQSNGQCDKLRDVRSKEDQNEKATGELPRFPSKSRGVVAILPSLNDSDQDQGEDDGEWQDGGHGFDIGRSPGEGDP